MLKPFELYEAAKAKGVPMDSHATDLYLKATPEARALVREYEFASNVSEFTGSDGATWLDIPFAYEPAWPCRACGKHPRISVALTIPSPPWSMNPNAKQETVGSIDHLCLGCYKETYGAPGAAKGGAS